MKPTNPIKSAQEVEIASVIDDCGTNSVATILVENIDEYNDGMARLAEYWG